MDSGIAKKGESEYQKLALAIKAGKKGDYKKALKILQEIIAGSFVPAESWLLLGRTYHALGDYSRALAAFNDYLKQKPRSSQGYLFMGRTYLAVGMPQRAVRFLRKAHELHPDNIQVTSLLAMACLKSRHSREAVDLFQAAVETAAKSGMAGTEYKRVYRAYLNALLVRGVRLCRINDYDLGSQMLHFVLENGEEGIDGPFIRLELGRACRETGRLEEALQHYSRALDFAPDDRRIRWSRVSILMALGRNRDAMEDIEKIRAKEPGLPELPWNSGLVDIFLIRSFLEAGEWRSAAALCVSYLRREGKDIPGAAMIHALCAEALRNLRDFPAAHNHLTRAQEKEPEETEFWYADILVSWEGKDWKSLRKALRKAKSLGGDTDIIIRFTALLEAATCKDEKETLSLLQNTVRKLGPEPELMHALGEAYLKVGFSEEALGWFRKTIYFKDNHELARLGEIAALEVMVEEGGNISKAAKNTDTAADKLVKSYNAYLERWPDNINIRREKALFLIKIFEYAEAAAELEKLLILEPSNQSLRRVLAYTYRKTGRYREAAVFLKALLREKPDNLELLIEYSGCVERAGGIQYALAILEKARGIFRESVDLTIALGIFNFRSGKTKEAFALLDEAAALDTGDPRPYEWMAVIARKNGEVVQAQYYNKEAQKRKKNPQMGVAEQKNKV